MCLHTKNRNDAPDLPLQRCSTVKPPSVASSFRFKEEIVHELRRHKECAGDDLPAKWGMPFTRAMKLKPDETAIFAFKTIVE